MSDEPRNDEIPTPAEPAQQEQDVQPKEEPRAPIIKGQEGIEGALVWISAFVIVIAGVIAYSNCFGIPFHRASKTLIVNNDAMHSVLTATEAVGPQSPRLLPALALALCWGLAPGNPVPFHILALGLHLACGVLLFLLCRRLSRNKIAEPIAMLPGLLFVLHPAATQTVNDIVSTPILMGTALTLLAVLLYLRAAREPDRVCMWPLFVSFTAFAGAWFSYPAAIILPLILLTADWLRGEKLLKRRPIHASYWGLGLAFALTQWAARTGSPRPAGERLVLWAQSLYPYIELTFLRRPLCVVHAFEPSSMAIAGGTAAVLCLLGVYLASRRYALGLALLWYLAALAATLWFMAAANSASGPVLTEPALYLALAGLVTFIPPLFLRLPSRGPARTAAGIAFAVLAIVAGIATFVRNGVWHDEATLWADVTAKNAPEGIVLGLDHAVPADAECYMGKLLREQGEATLLQAAQLEGENMAAAAAERREDAQKLFLGAEEHLRKAEEFEPGNALILFELGACLDALGKPDEALDFLLHALSLDTANAECAARIASALQVRAMTTGNADELRRAIDYYRRAERLAPLSPQYSLNYALALAGIGELERAEGALALLAKEEGDTSPAARALRDIRGTLTRSMQARREAAESLNRAPGNADGIEKMVQALLLHKDLLGASYALEPLLAPERVTPLRWAMMAYIRAKMEATQSFLSEWPSPPKAEQGKPSGWVLATSMCASEGLWDSAETYANGGAAAGEVPQPLLLLGETALQLRQLDKAQDYLQRATQEYADSPAPWLRLSDLALAQNDPSSAQRLLGEAEKRGASEDALKPRRERLQSGVKEGQEGAPSTIMR